MVRGARGWLWAFGVCGFLGCGSPSAPTGAPSQAQAFPNVVLKVGVLGDPGLLKTVSSTLRGEWEATRGARLDVRTASLDPKELQGLDVLLFPGDLTGGLVDVGVLATISEKDVRPPTPEDSSEAPGNRNEATDPLQFSDVLPAFREQVTRYGKTRTALPYGGSALVLVYHKTAFEREANRAAAKDKSIKLEPPDTWEQFDALARFFQGRDWDGDGTPDQGVALALGEDSEGVGDALVLSRAAGLGLPHDQYAFLFDTDTMAPRVDGPPFVEALRGLAALKECGPPGAEAFDAEGARAAFRKGNVALLIDRAEQVERWGHDKASPVGVAPLPGSERVYDAARESWERVSPPNRPSYLPHGGGWVVGVGPRTSPGQRQAALDFAKYLAGPEAANRVRADRDFPMLPVRSAVIGTGLLDPRAAPGVEAREWSEAVGRTLAAARVVPGLRIPEADGYLSDLGKGRAAAAKGEPAERALKGVARAWSTRTERLGTERQLWHYKRSLNSLVTAPEPPPR